MKVHFKEINISTSSRVELIDVSDQVEAFVNNSGVTNGICVISSLHSTTAIMINENERGLIVDILRKVSSDFPRGAGWSHDKIDDNADAHLASTFLGSSKTLPVKDGRLIRGTWQNIFFMELDGPRSRRLMLEILGE